MTKIEALGLTPERKFEPQPRLDVETQYLTLLEELLYEGKPSADRTGTGTLKLFGRQLKHDMSGGKYPLLTTKDTWFKGIRAELVWFIRGERNIRPLVLQGVNIWDEWPLQRYLKENGNSEKYPKGSEGWKEQMELFSKRIKEDKKFAEIWGDAGPIYGYQWRHWRRRDGHEIDQLANAINLIKNNPDSRRIVVSAWNPEDLAAATLPPCHVLYQFQVDGEKLNCAMYQRSVDSFLGLPFNIASYAALTAIVAQITDKVPGEITYFLGDVHLYLNHREQARTQLKNEPYPLTTLHIDPSLKTLDDVSSDLIKIGKYQHHPKIEAPISV